MADLSVNKLESLLSIEEQLDMKVNHLFQDGIYVRELEIPKGALIVGKRHRESTINMLIKGSMTILDGEDRFTIKAPYTFVAEKYSKKAGYAHEDSVWVNIHRTDSLDLEEIEKQFIISEEEYNMIKYNKKESLCHG